MAAMNAVLHQFDKSPLIHRDSICGSEDKWDEVQFDYILENPPFSGSRGDAKRSLRIEKGDKYVLFLAAALRSLRQGGTAGIVFPNGLLFGDTNSHIYVKQRLINEFDLQAVVILPKGMFEPYTPNPTCFSMWKEMALPLKKPENSDPNTKMISLIFCACGRTERQRQAEHGWCLRKK